MPALRRSAPLVAWILGLGALLVALHAVGGGGLAAPDLRQPGSWSDWAAARTPAEAAMAVLRLVALALGWYLLVVTALAVALRLGQGGGRLVTVADVITLPFVRGLVQAAVGVGLAGAAVAAVGAAGPSGRVPTAAEVALVATVAGDATAEADDEPVVMQRLPVDDAAPVMQQVLDEPAPVPAGDHTWVVGAGDHLWSIAERVLAESWGRSPDDAEVVPYWQQVIELNRAELPDPGNPDLLFPGQRLHVPTPPAPPTP